MNPSIVVPAFNEYETLEQNVWKLSERFPNAEILIIENGTDISPNLGYLNNVRVLNCIKKGLGIALKYGISIAHNNAVVFMPADLSYNLNFVEHASYLIEKGWDLVIGSKAVSIPEDIDRAFIRKEISYAYNLFYNSVYNLRIGDITGVKGYNQANVLPLMGRCKSDGILFEVQLIREMRKEHMRIVEIPVIVKDRRKGAYVPW